MDKDSIYEVLEARVANLHEQSKIAAAGLEHLVQQRTAELTHIISTLHEEVLERLQAEQALHDVSQQLRATATHLTMAEQRERQRLAKILHDTLQQLLVATIYTVRDLRRSPDESVQKTATTLEDLLRQSIEVTRSLTSELNPPSLRQGGLAPALQWLARHMCELHSLNVELTTPGETIIEPEEIKILLFDAVRELLFNVVKHANTQRAAVLYEKSGNVLRIDVTDQGCGFTPSDAPLSTGFGLSSIRERLSLFGGTMTIVSSPGVGSTFTLQVPTGQ